MWLQFRANFAGRYIEMRMCRVHLSVRTEGLKAFQNGYGVIVWTGENDTDENDKCGRIRIRTSFQVENGAKQLRFHLKTD